MTYSHPVIMVMIKEEEEKEYKPMMIPNDHETFAVLQYTRSVVTKLSGRNNSNRILIALSIAITRIRKLHILHPLQLQLQLQLD
mmetsp:Transcript_21006/g.24059  ORF Transcript_21006/g.24059 Transcript_21006/m.24059 type:complete len:84 (-) Transcript_21006:13-264(-)